MHVSNQPQPLMAVLVLGPAGDSDVEIVEEETKKEGPPSPSEPHELRAGG